MNKILGIFLIIFIVCIIPVLYFIDKTYFLCPIEYKKGIIVRRDKWGMGDFAAPRAGGRKHKGIDLSAQIGTDIRAVRFARVNDTGLHRRLGNYVELSHSSNLVTIYGHLSKILVQSGQWVEQGKVIGYVGNTGNASLRGMEPHLHFEVRKNSIPINSQNYLEGR